MIEAMGAHADAGDRPGQCAANTGNRLGSKTSTGFDSCGDAQGEVVSALERFLLPSALLSSANEAGPFCLRVMALPLPVQWRLYHSFQRY